jgi:ABC-type bacteriocin/lantibiotic exporter with double-glycine peptidase domain
MGLHQPWSGEILFDGRRRDAIAPRALNASLAGVDQEVFLFSGSVRDNLSLWDDSMPEPDLVRAGHDAAIHATVAARSGGYDAEVSEGAANFSGGQRQRLEIARALAGNPRILVLDEATAALDTATEKEIDDNLRRRGCTCLIVAHRLSTIRDCDEIIVMEQGRIVERGTHDVLLARGGAYAALVGEIAA